MPSAVAPGNCDSHQEYNRRSPDERDGCGELPFIASTVASSLPISILSQSQLLHTPLCHLQHRSLYTDTYTSN